MMGAIGSFYWSENVNKLGSTGAEGEVLTVNLYSILQSCGSTIHNGSNVDTTGLSVITYTREFGLKEVVLKICVGIQYISI